MLVHSLFWCKMKEHKHAMRVTSSPISCLQCGIIAAGIGDAKIYDHEQNCVWPLAQEAPESTLEQNHSRLTLLLCSSLGSPLFRCRQQDARSPAALLRSHTDALVAAHWQMVSGSEILVGFALLDLPFPTYGTQMTSGCAPQSQFEQIQRTLRRIPRLFPSANETAGCPSLQVTPLWKKMSFASLEKCTAMWTCLLMLNNNASEPSPSGLQMFLPAIVPISCKIELFQLVAGPNTDSVIFLNCLRTGVLHNNRPILAIAALQKATRLTLHAAITYNIKYAWNILSLL